MTTITKIDVKAGYPPLTSFVWEAIPPLAIIGGVNGAGKSRLLSLIAQTGQGGRVPMTWEPQTSLNGVINYVNSRFTPESLHKGAQGTAGNHEMQYRAFFDYVKARGSTPNASPKHKEFEEIISEIEDLSKSVIKTLSNDEIVENIPVDFFLRMGNFLNNQYIAETFYAYQRKLDRKKSALFGCDTRMLTEADLILEIGHKPPWEAINSSFEKYGFEFRMERPTSDVGYVPWFLSIKDPKDRVQFHQLSDGEQTIVTLLLWAYNSRLGDRTKLFLLDEFDSHLNPAMSKMLLEIIRDKIVGEFKIQTLMTTHSPSTVAWARDEELFWIERGQPIRQSSRAEMIPILSDGIITVSDESASLGIALRIEATEKPILCVEGITDKLIVEEAWLRTHGRVESPWEVIDMFDSNFIIHLFRKADLFHSYQTRKFVGLLDFDDASARASEKLTGSRDWAIVNDSNDSVEYYRFFAGNASLTTLVVPSFRTSIAGRRLRKSSLTIELLFEDRLVNEFCDQIPIANIGIVPVFKKRCKSRFAREIVPEFKDDDFTHFVPLFSHLKKLI